MAMAATDESIEIGVADPHQAGFCGLFALAPQLVSEAREHPSAIFTTGAPFDLAAASRPGEEPPQ